MEKTGTPLSIPCKIDRILFRFYKYLSYVSAAGLIVVALLCTANVLTSKIFKFGITNATEMITYLNIPVVFLAIAFIQVERGHTMIDLLWGKYPKWLQKTVSCVGNLLGAMICSYIGYRGVILTIKVFKDVEKASAARNSFVIWPFAAIVALGFLALALAFIWSAVRDFLIPKEQQCGYMPPATQLTFDKEEEEGSPQ